MRTRITRPKPFVPKEHEVQKAIVDALRLVGFGVKETTAYKQKGPSGVDKAIADLLIFHPSFEVGKAFNEEVKRPGKIKYSSPEQRQAHAAGMFVIVQSVEEALRHAAKFLFGNIDTAEEEARATLARVDDLLAQLAKGPRVAA